MGAQSTLKGIGGTLLCPYSKKAPKVVKGGGSTMQAARVARRNKLMRTVDIMVKKKTLVHRVAPRRGDRI